MDNYVVYEEDTYGTILLNREHKRNAISAQMALQLSELLDDLAKSPPKFLVIKSAGDNIFCAGGDLTELHGDLDEQTSYERLHKMKEVLYKIANFPVLTISLLQGNALGGGCELATSTDIRIAKNTAKFGFIQSNLGILPGWGGGALLYRKVHPSFALQWITEGNVYDAQFLKQRGWIHQVIDESDWQNEQKILDNYISKSKAQMQFLKSQYVAALQLDQLKERMNEESRASSKLWPSEEHKKAVDQFLNK